MSRYGDVYRLLRFYQKVYDHYLRVKVPIGNGPFVIMETEEIEQFPENYEFNVPTVGVRHNRGYHMPGRS